MTYKAASEELSSILAELQNGTLDVDQIGERVARAGELIALCREKIENARASIKHVNVDG